MKSIEDNRRSFGIHLRKLRSERNWTLRALGSKSNVTDSTLSAIECGDKVVGDIVGAKIANGLGLLGSERESFLVQAADTRKKDRLVGSSRRMPSEVLNFLPQSLSRLGLGDGDIKGCRLVGGKSPHPMEAKVSGALLEAALMGSSAGNEAEVLLLDTSTGSVACAIVVAKVG